MSKVSYSIRLVTIPGGFGSPGSDGVNRDGWDGLQVSSAINYVEPS